MPRTDARRLAASAVISAALAAGSLSLTTPAAGAGTTIAASINCPPPNPSVTAQISDC